MHVPGVHVCVLSPSSGLYTVYCVVRIKSLLVWILIARC